MYGTTLAHFLIQLTVVAEDKGIPVRNSSATIVITLIDENDERPQFLQDAYM